MSDSSPPRASKQEAKAKRSRTGCLTCRTRKIKCDETPGRCSNCSRVMLECRWPEQDLPSHVTTRSRCSRDRPCERCRDQALSCEDVPEPALPTTTATTATTTATKTPKNLLATDGIDDSVLNNHLEAFFTRVYPCQANAFIHRASLLRDIHAGRAKRALLLALCATSARFLPDPPVGRECGWAREAKALLILVGETDVQTVAALLLMAKHDIHCGRFGSAWMLAAMATRAALALGLHRDTSSSSSSSSSPEDLNELDPAVLFVEQETRRRLFWACYTLDRMMATGQSDLMIVQPDLVVNLPLPCEEHSFQLGITCQTPCLVLRDKQREEKNNDGPSREAGPGLVTSIFGQYVQLMTLRSSILRYTRHTAKNTTVDELAPWEPGSQWAQWEARLHAWRGSLPAQCQLRPDTIYARQAQHQLVPLMMLHVWFDQCMADLYRMMLPGFPESLSADLLLAAPAGWVEQHQTACVRHSRGILHTLTTVARHVDLTRLPFLDASLPSCVFESMRVQLQALYMLPSEARPAALTDAKRGFDALMIVVNGMARFFRQAQWLLHEMRNMLSRYGIPIQQEESPDTPVEGQDHPWQRRIQQLKQGLPDIPPSPESQQALLHNSLLSFDSPDMYLEVTNLLEMQGITDE
ncbi:hypothetical protein ASPZODRAFT_13184 [Penicilliopsis zonata CBS 506.65]|uniref:Zn(2)-C6 fungal-type domain-containing protein n=1 Tax=Penicilliopsis zonata CBS 506.65 TaxID=1073090 RepID=A0A1L9SSJ8_9EURO|nr:hypothetical protein ASPZODRAFT_13184 [Penicilliopsis zonata CBS 506.65]OJJ50086.1 hypothetical protein ASPZODRAFT_13184 [Penicilliopsis zonata CBS 506.65]